jgi:hypothetical protein
MNHRCTYCWCTPDINNKFMVRYPVTHLFLFLCCPFDMFFPCLSFFLIAFPTYTRPIASHVSISFLFRPHSGPRFSYHKALVSATLVFYAFRILTRVMALLALARIVPVKKSYFFALANRYWSFASEHHRLFAELQTLSDQLIALDQSRGRKRWRIRKHKSETNGMSLTIVACQHVREAGVGQQSLRCIL